MAPARADKGWVGVGMGESPRAVGLPVGCLPTSTLLRGCSACLHPSTGATGQQAEAEGGTHAGAAAPAASLPGQAAPTPRFHPPTHLKLASWHSMASPSATTVCSTHGAVYLGWLMK